MGGYQRLGKERNQLRPERKDPGKSSPSCAEFHPAPRMNYRLGVSGSEYWKEILNSDAVEYGGSGQGNLGGVSTDAHAFHGKEHSIRISLPPLGALFFKNEV